MPEIVKKELKDRISKGELSALASKIKEELDQDYDDDDYEDYEEERLETASIPSEEEVKEEIAAYETDIFTDIGEVRAKAGDLVRYEIFKNNQMLTSVLHPYSWEKLQQDHGGGYYKVTAKSSTTGKYLKKQSRQVAELSGKKEDSPLNAKFFDMLSEMNKTMQEQQLRQEEKLRKEREEYIKSMTKQQEKLMQEQQNQQNALLTMITAMMTKPQDNSSKEIMAMMMQMQQQNMAMMTSLGNKKDETAPQIMQMIMQMNQNTMQLIKEMNDSSARSFEKISEKFELLKDKGNDGMSMVELYTKAMSQGFEQMKLVNELADRKAEERAGNESDEEDSITKTLIKSVAPVLGQVAQQNMMANQQREQQQMVMARQNNIRNQNAARNTQSRASSPSNAPKTQVQGQNRSPQRQASGSNTQKNNLGLPVATPKKVVEVVSKEDKTPKSLEKVAKPANKVNNEPTVQRVEKSEKTAKINGKEKATELILPVIGQCLLASEQPFDAARMAISVLRQNSFDPVKTIKLFKQGEFVTIAKKHGLEDKDYPGLEKWLNELYDSISLFATPTTGEPTRDE